MRIQAPHRAGRSAFSGHPGYPDAVPRQLPFHRQHELRHSLRSIYGLPGLTNYSIGGARTNNTNTLQDQGLNEGFPYELQQFANSGTHFMELRPYRAVHRR